MDTAQLLDIAHRVHSAAIRGTDWAQWRNFGRRECDAAFTREALAAGVPDKSRELCFVVTKCLSLSGYGS